VPLSTDLYLPALPTMTAYFHVYESQTNLTLIMFFIVFALGTLIWGPLSDKYGRRPILLDGLAGYTLASLLCAAAVNISQLILFRVPEGFCKSESQYYHHEAHRLGKHLLAETARCWP
jgi:MFS transporter, DHA1 family, multidrug resistance protein